MYLLLNWNHYEDTAIVTSGAGAPLFFETQDEAEQYGQEELNFFWQAVRLSGEGRRKEVQAKD